MTPLHIVLAVFGISFLVIVHELGHYLAARAFGMRVLRFSIGLGPTIFRYQPKGSPTIFQVCAIPLLAYVQIAGMHPSEVIDPKDGGLFPNAGVFARISTIFAGPFANYLAASLIVFAIALTGFPEQVAEPMTVGSLEAGYPAAAAGLHVGDVITRANGETIHDVDDLRRVTATRGGKPTAYVVERGGRARTVSITPRAMNGSAVIGVGAQMRIVYKPHTVGDAAKLAVVLPAELTVLQLKGMAEMVQKRSTEGLTGPVGMGKVVAEQASRGWLPYVMILMQISVALGLFNLLPVPALDGGRLMFLVFELITKRRPPERFEAVVHTVGLLVLLGILVLVTFRDAVG